MMDFQTKVALPTDLPAINHAQHILLMGSCFAENIGSLLTENKFDVDINPFGILYNPLSVSTALDEIVNGKSYAKDDLVYYKECWHSMMHHGSFSSAQYEDTLWNINNRLSAAHKSFDTLDRLLITWGTAYVYEDKETGKIVSNCHKMPEQNFNRRLLSVDEIVEKYSPLITDIKAFNPNLKIIFTVSPIRHLRDGMHANQLSKSTLLLAIHELQQLFCDQLSANQVFYFPSYEIVMDELRDYRFYADDMLHPSPVAIRYLWERFSDAFFSLETKQVMEEVQDIHKDLTHKPFHPESETYQRFLKQIVLKIERLNRKYPYLDFKNEIELCHTRLNP